MTSLSDHSKATPVDLISRISGYLMAMALLATEGRPNRPRSVGIMPGRAGNSGPVLPLIHRLRTAIGAGPSGDRQEAWPVSTGERHAALGLDRINRAAHP